MYACARPPPGNAQAHLKCDQGLDRYCWLVLLAAVPGCRFDTIDQNLFTMVKAPSVNTLLREHYAKGPELDRSVANQVGIVAAVVLLGCRRLHPRESFRDIPPHLPALCWMKFGAPYSSRRSSFRQ